MIWLVQRFATAWFLFWFRIAAATNTENQQYSINLQDTSTCASALSVLDHNYRVGPAQSEYFLTLKPDGATNATVFPKVLDLARNSTAENQYKNLCTAQGAGWCPSVSLKIWWKPIDADTFETTSVQDLVDLYDNTQVRTFRTGLHAHSWLRRWLSVRMPTPMQTASNRRIRANVGKPPDRSDTIDVFNDIFSAVDALSDPIFAAAQAVLAEWAEPEQSHIQRRLQSMQCISNGNMNEQDATDVQMESGCNELSGSIGFCFPAACCRSGTCDLLSGVDEIIYEHVNDLLSKLCNSNSSQEIPNPAAFCTDGNPTIEIETGCGNYSVFEMIVLISVIVASSLLAIACCGIVGKYVYIWIYPILRQRFGLQIFLLEPLLPANETRANRERVEAIEQSQQEYAMLKHPEQFNTECTICLDAYEPTSMIYNFPKCQHLFHAKCLLQWVKSRSTCPVCRMEWQTNEDTATTESGDVATEDTAISVTSSRSTMHSEEAQMSLLNSDEATNQMYDTQPVEVVGVDQENLSSPPASADSSQHSLRIHHAAD